MKLPNKFPKISRSLTEKEKRHLFIWSIASASIALSALVLIFSFLLFTQVQKQREHERIKNELSIQVKFWKDVIVSKPDYRDAYFSLSILEYRLKNIKEAKFYLEKTLILDPNFKEGNEFKKTLGSY